MTTTLSRRILPPSVDRIRSRYVLERNVLVYRRLWLIVLSGFFEPVFYLFSIGIGISELVGDVVGPNGQLVEYTAFVAPALLAASAMNGAVFESTMNIFYKLKWAKTYDGMLAAPLSVWDIAIGEISWSQIRGGLYAGAFLIVMLRMDLLQSWWSILALPAALLIGVAFGAAGFATTTYLKSWQDFDLITLVTMLLFLFSATFFPLDVYPPVLQAIAQISPLYHGVEIIRALTLGAVDSGIWVHIGFLVVMTIVGLTITARRLEQLLKA
ncbi:MAG: ABC transporter permease [bacterium]|nr:ABC transporter permease [bacterium]MCP4965442.1 ABC transporter permease [bacterium]